MLGNPSFRAGCLGGAHKKGSTRSATPEPKARLGFRKEQPGNGAVRESTRASYYANPPSNFGLNGLQLDSDLNKRRGYVRNGVVGVPRDVFVRKGKPL